MERPGQHANSERQKGKTVFSISKTNALLVQHSFRFISSPSPQDTVNFFLFRLHVAPDKFNHRDICDDI